MSDSTTDAPVDTIDDDIDEPDQTNGPVGQPDDKTDWKAEARKWEDRAKANQKAAKDLDAQRKAAMTESERAVAEAEERGRKAATSAYGERLTRGEFVAEAARRNPGFDATSILEDVNFGRYIGDDGEPDGKAIAAAVSRLIPAPAGPPSFDGGARKSADKPADMNTLIRRQAGLQR